MSGGEAANWADLAGLMDQHACRQLLERYTYAVDWMDWAGLEPLFWPDAKFDFGLWSGDLAAYIPWVTQLESGYQRRLHLFGLPRLSLDGERGKAEAGALMYLRLMNAEGEPQDELMAGRYLFDVERREGEWRLSRLAFLMHGAQRFAATDNGGADFFADGLSPGHRLFRPWP